MNAVKNQYGREIDFDAALNIMDDKIRVWVWIALMGCDNAHAQNFFDAYCEYHLARFGEEFELNKENPVW